jgi:hypothetical protein
VREYQLAVEALGRLGEAGVTDGVTEEPVRWRFGDAGVTVWLEDVRFELRGV